MLEGDEKVLGRKRAWWPGRRRVDGDAHALDGVEIVSFTDEEVLIREAPDLVVQRPKSSSGLISGSTARLAHGGEGDRRTGHEAVGQHREDGAELVLEEKVEPTHLGLKHEAFFA